jgi:hypothetical protein
MGAPPAVTQQYEYKPTCNDNFEKDHASFFFIDHRCGVAKSAIRAPGLLLA